MRSDLISRQDAIKWCKPEEWGTPDERWRPESEYGAMLKALPSVQQWIPCSERLPSDEYYDKTFIVTIQCEHYDGWDDYVTGYADWTPHGWDIQSYYIGQIKVVAWMPLPEPYKEKDNE